MVTLTTLLVSLHPKLSVIKEKSPTLVVVYNGVLLLDVELPLLTHV